MGLRTSINCGNLYANRGWLGGVGVYARPRITISHRTRPSAEYRHLIATDQRHYDAIAQLEVTVSVRNAQAFENILNSINWESRLASEFNRAIDLALKIGAYTSARRISQIGQVRYPQDERLQKYHTILAEPVVTQRAVPFDPSIRANRDWLKAHRDEYRGRWIGLRNGNLVAAADTIDELMNSMENSRDALITRVY